MPLDPFEKVTVLPVRSPSAEISSKAKERKDVCQRKLEGIDTMLCLGIQ